MGDSIQTGLDIAICDDRLQDRERLLRLIEQYVQDQGIDARVDCYESGEALLAAMAKNEYSLLFLDIYMNGMSGVETARKIRAQSGCAIVFVTTSRDHALEGFEVDAVHYLVKPANYDGVCECFRRCAPVIEKFARRIDFKSDRETVYIREADITYVEVFGNRLVVHTNQREFETYTPLSAFYARLDQKQFIHPHRSYIVNLAYINEIPGSDVVLKNGMHISISRGERAKIKQAYLDYLLLDIRGTGGGIIFNDN